MNDNEKIILIMKYTWEAETHLHNEYIDLLNSYIITPHTRPQDILRLYRSKIRYEAFKEFTSDLERILYNRGF